MDYKELKVSLKVPETWCVIPLKKGTKNGFMINDRKIEWQPYSKDGITEEDFKSWGVLDYKAYNWGVLTGKCSGIFVVDLDGVEGIKNFEEKATVDIDSLDTVQSISGSGVGRHLYFKLPTHTTLKNSASKIAPNVDVRANGGFLVIPPSIHPSGGSYKWVDGKSPSEIPVAQCPQWLLNLLETDIKPRSSSAASPDDDVQKLIDEGAAQGGRNDATARVAGYYCNKGLDFDTILMIINQWNTTKNKPPLPDDEVERTVKSIFDTASETTNPFLTDKGGIRYAALAQHLINEYHVKYVVMQKTLYIWDGTRYVADTYFLKLREICGELVGHGRMFKKNYDNLLDTLLEHPEIKVQDVVFPNRKILFNNGLYDPVADTLTPVTPEDFIAIRVPHEYLKDTTCPKFLKYLGEALEPCYINFIQEYMGYCLTTDVSFQKAVILFGRGGNGKSVLIDIINAMVSPENTSALNLEKICSPSHKFAVIDLRNKLVNSSAENSTHMNFDMDTIKGLITGDEVFAEAKGVQGFKFRPVAKHIYSLNEEPRFKDNSDSVKDRFEIVKFNHNFRTDNPDRTLARRIIESETEGIIAWAIEGLKRLYQRDKFTITTEMEGNKSEMEYYSNTVVAFVTDCCTVAPGIEIKSGTIYDLYKKYCEDNGNTPVAQKRLKSIILEKYSKVEFKKRKDANYFIGITVS